MPKAKRKPVVLLSSKAQKELVKLYEQYVCIENNEDAESNYAYAKDDLLTAEQDFRELQASCQTRLKDEQFNVNEAKKHLEAAAKDVIRSRMTIKKIALQLAKLIDQMDKPTKKRRKRVKKIVVKEEEYISLDRQA